jgi:hypothetical protein
MRTIKLETSLGNTIGKVAENAKLKAIEENAIVEFDFNEIVCKVSANTNTDHLVRDYMNAHLMDWKTIGYNCFKEYPTDLKKQIADKQQERKLRHDKEMKAYRQKEADDKKAFQKLIEGVDFKVKDQKAYDSWKAKNTDGYGAVIFEYAENWAKMLQTKLETKPLIELVEDFDLQPNYLGISGFQHGASKQILRECWFYGNELKKAVEKN